MAAPHPALLRLVREEPFPPGLRVTMPLADSPADHGMAPLLDGFGQNHGNSGLHNALMHVAVYCPCTANSSQLRTTIERVHEAL